MCRDHTAQRMSWCELQAEKCVQNGEIFLRFIKEKGLGVGPSKDQELTVVNVMMNGI
jgi:hypothetical protein